MISNLLKSISELWPFSQTLEMNEEGFFVSAQTSDGDSATESYHSEATDEIDWGMSHGIAVVSLAIPAVYIPVSYLTVSFSRLRSSHSS